jgi:peptidoglycan/xylan/chitin deacetylase (PgdA/CDA1 family)
VRVHTILRKGIKASVLPLGLLRPRRPGDVVILLYHRVADGDREIDLPLRTFERHLATLEAHDRAVPLERALGDPRGGVVLTFDDGYRDFHEHVLPLLVRYRMPALLYLATGLVEGSRSSLGRDALSWSMLRESMTTGLVEVGAHTHGHADLSTASEAEADREMRRSKELIEGRLGAPCRHFAYPWGVASVEAERVARSLFETAVRDGWKTNRRERWDRHRLGRTPILRSDGRFFFRAKTLGLLDSEALAYRALRRGPWGPPERRVPTLAGGERNEVA